MINIRALKARITARYPSETIASVLRDAPDEVKPDEFVGMIQSWQSIIDASEFGKEGRNKQ